MTRIVEQMTDRAGILDECDKILHDMANIREQLDAARAKARDQGEYSNSEWFRRANKALRLRGRRHQALLRRASELRNAEQYDSEETWDSRFVEVARRRLTSDAFAAIVEEVDGRDQE